MKCNDDRHIMCGLVITTRTSNTETFKIKETTQ